MVNPSIHWHGSWLWWSWWCASSARVEQKDAEEEERRATERSSFLCLLGLLEREREREREETLGVREIRQKEKKFYTKLSQRRRRHTRRGYLDQRDTITQIKNLRGHFFRFSLLSDQDDDDEEEEISFCHACRLPGKTVCRGKPFAGKKTRGRDRKEKQSTAKREDARHGWNVLRQLAHGRVFSLLSRE